MVEPDYTLVCDKCGVELPTTPHYAVHLRDAHGMQTSAAIKAAKVARENKGVESYAAIKAERDALRAALRKIADGPDGAGVVMRDIACAALATAQEEGRG